MTKRRWTTTAVSEKAIRLYNWMVRFYAGCGYMPTVREMCADLNYTLPPPAFTDDDIDE